MVISQIPGGMTICPPIKFATLIANSTIGASIVALAGVVNVILVCAALRSGVIDKRLTSVFCVGE